MKRKTWNRKQGETWETWEIPKETEETVDETWENVRGNGGNM